MGGTKRQTAFQFLLLAFADLSKRPKYYKSLNEKLNYKIHRFNPIRTGSLKLLILPGEGPYGPPPPVA